MKVTFEFTEDQVIIINSLLKLPYQINFNSLTTTEDKIEYSICYELSDKFELKTRNIQKRNKSNKKKIKITIKYYQAWAMKNFLIKEVNFLENHHKVITIENSIRILDKKVNSKDVPMI